MEVEKKTAADAPFDNTTGPSNKHQDDVLSSSAAGQTIPPEYLCPITNGLMQDPVMDREGNSYEAWAIEDWLHRGNATSPITRNPLVQGDLIPNRSLKSGIERFIQENPVVATQSGLVIPPTVMYSAPHMDSTAADVALDTPLIANGPHLEAALPAPTSETACTRLGDCCKLLGMVSLIIFPAGYLFYLGMLSSFLSISFPLLRGGCEVTPWPDMDFASDYYTPPMQQKVVFGGMIMFAIGGGGMGLVLVPLAQLIVWIACGTGGVKKYVTNEKSASNIFMVMVAMVWVGLTMVWGGASDLKSSKGCEGTKYGGFWYITFIYWWVALVWFVILLLFRPGGLLRKD